MTGPRLPASRSFSPSAAPAALRRLFSRISNRLLAFNLLLVFLPTAGVLYLDVYERQLLSALEVSMVQQGRILAAAVGERGAIDPAAATEILQRLERRLNARLRVIAAREGDRRQQPARPTPAGAAAGLRRLPRRRRYPAPASTSRAQPALPARLGI